MSAAQPFEHADLVTVRHRFENVIFRGQPWNLAHLDPIVLQHSLPDGQLVSIVVLFSCHCFSKSAAADGTSPANELYTDGYETRHLCEIRFSLSRTLPALIAELPTRTIKLAHPGSGNFFTLGAVDDNGGVLTYAVFFDVERDSKRKRRMILRVQSAYPLETMSSALKKAGKVRFAVLVRRIYEGGTFRA